MCCCFVKINVQVKSYVREMQGNRICVLFVRLGDLIPVIGFVLLEYLAPKSLCLFVIH